MVKKFVFVVSQEEEDCDDPDRGDREVRRALLERNARLHAELHAQKNNIWEHYKSKRWDRFKKHSNDYELVFTSTAAEHPSISTHVPSSRSFFKMWEILDDFKDDIRAHELPAMRVAFLAEGPGGFVEAFHMYRKTHAPDARDATHGMTLLSSDRNIPSWKLPSAVLHETQLCRGADGTGNLYNIENIDALVDSAGAGACHLVTADGGFDFSNDFNNQEELSQRLIAAEILAALRLQAPGGCFVLKVYDVMNETTLVLLRVLRRCYDRLYVVKPLTSRPANSEKYVVCAGFRKSAPEVESSLARFVATCDPGAFAGRAFAGRAFAGGAFAEGDAEGAFAEGHFAGNRLPTAFLRDILDMNAYYVYKQIMHIQKTLLFILIDKLRYHSDQPDAKKDVEAFFMDNLHAQLRKAIKWCHKYKIKICTASIRKYKDMFRAAAVTGLI